MPVLDQGLVEMNFFITIQPSSLGITTTVAECSWLHPTHCGDVSRLLHVPRLLPFEHAAAGADLQQDSRLGHPTRARVRAARAVATRELAWYFSLVPRAISIQLCAYRDRVRVPELGTGRTVQKVSVSFLREIW